METVSYYDEICYTRKINVASKFILIANNIDGRVNFNFCEFNDFEDVKNKLPQILLDTKGEGEWDMKLYQVPDNYRIAMKYEYYRHPNRGKLIYCHSYMDSPIKKIIFNKGHIIIVGLYLEIEENWLSEDIFYEKDVMIEIKKIRLK